MLEEGLTERCEVVGSEGVEHEDEEARIKASSIAEYSSKSTYSTLMSRFIEQKSACLRAHL